MTTAVTPARETLAAALTAAGQGWHVFPLVPGGKRAAVKDWESRATTDETRIRRCWSTPTSHGPYGVGIACGPSGLLVVDLDRPKGRPLPKPWRLPGVVDGMDVLAVLADRAGAPFPWDTHTVATGSGGTHLYFAQPPGAELRNSAGRLGPLIDTRGHGGYVVAAGTHVEGRGYTTVDDTDPARCSPGSPTALPLPRAPSRSACPRRRSCWPRCAAGPPMRPRPCVGSWSGSSPRPRARATRPSTPPRTPSAGSSPPG